MGAWDGGWVRVVNTWTRHYSYFCVFALAWWSCTHTSMHMLVALSPLTRVPWVASCCAQARLQRDTDDVLCILQAHHPPRRAPPAPQQYLQVFRVSARGVRVVPTAIGTLFENNWLDQGTLTGHGAGCACVLGAAVRHADAPLHDCCMACVSDCMCAGVGELQRSHDPAPAPPPIPVDRPRTN